jgi:integrase
MVKSRKKKRLQGSPPPRRPNSEKRVREYLTPEEVKDMLDAAKTVGRHGLRDALLILVAYRHALRISELVDLRWERVDLDGVKMHVNRIKNGDPSAHYLEGDEI